MFDPMQSMNAFAAGAQLGGGIRNRETQNAFSKKIGAGDLRGARQYAYDRGAMDLGQGADAMIAQMEAQERAQATQRAETIARSAITLKGIADPTERTQAYMQMLPELEGAGLSAQELQKFNPTDDNALQAIINQVTPLAELLKAQAPQKMMNVAPGNTVFDPNTGRPVFTADRPAQEITPYQQAQLDLQRDRLDWDKTKPRTPLVQVNTGDEGPRMGKVPDGMSVVSDPSHPSGFRLEPISGSDAEMERTRANSKAYQAIRANDEQFNAIMSNIDAADELIGNFTAGMGATLDMIPGTPAKDLAARLETVKANIGFDKLNEIRQTSPTGGALGSITESELNFLQSVRGSLDSRQSPQQLRETLQEVKASLQRLAEVRKIAFQLEQQNAGPGQIRPTETVTNSDLPPGFEIVQ